MQYSSKHVKCGPVQLKPVLFKGFWKWTWISGKWILQSLWQSLKNLKKYNWYSKKAEKWNNIKCSFWNSLVVQWLGLGTFTARAWVQSLVRELQSCNLCITAKKKKKVSIKTHRKAERVEDKNRNKEQGQQIENSNTCGSYYSNFSNNHFKCQLSKCPNCKAEYHSGSKSKTLLCVVYKINTLNIKTQAD